MSHPTARTRVVGIIGDPVRHSLSPVIHAAAIDALGLDWVYVAFEVPHEDGAAAIAGARALGLIGLTVTMPHKATAAATCDELTPLAATLGSVNTVVIRDDGSLLGDSTDGAGFIASLRDAAIAVRQASVVVAGAGGAAKAVVAALGAAGAARVVVVNRSLDAAEATAWLAGPVGEVGGPGDVAGADIVVNATACGMAGSGAPDLFPGAEDVHAGQVVADLVYHPRRTPLLSLAAQRGATTVDGVGMLVHQAAMQVEAWSGRAAPVEAMFTAAARELT